MIKEEEAELGLQLTQTTLNDKIEELIKADWDSSALKNDIKILVKEISFFKERLKEIHGEQEKI